MNEVEKQELVYIQISPNSSAKTNWIELLLLHNFKNEKGQGEKERNVLNAS